MDNAWRTPPTVVGQPVLFKMCDNFTIEGLFLPTNPGGSWMRYSQVKAKLGISHDQFMSCLIDYRRNLKIDDPRPFFVKSQDDVIWVRNFLPYRVEMQVMGKEANDCYFAHYQVDYLTPNR